MKKLVTIIAKGYSETVFRFLAPSVVKCVVSKNPEDQEICVRLPLLHRIQETTANMYGQIMTSSRQSEKDKKPILRKKAEETDPS